MAEQEIQFHVPVMTEEVMRYLNPQPGQIIVDATVGTAGHSQEIAERIMPGGRLICIDRDQESLAVARERLRRFGDACFFAHGNFIDIDRFVAQAGVQKIDGALFDLGISSFQLKDPKRGFSFQEDGPLDMRLDQDSYISAYDLVNNLNEDELSTLLWNFGQERWHNRIARLVVEERQREPIATTSRLAEIVARSIPVRYRHKFYRIHPATRTFQAVRIAVNRELEVIDTAITKAISLLTCGGTVCVIAFHSLEDRAVKLCFRRASAEGVVTIKTPKPLTPGHSEVIRNPSSRSSKFRAAQRI